MDMVDPFATVLLEEEIEVEAEEIEVVEVVEACWVLLVYPGIRIKVSEYGTTKERLLMNISW